MLVWLIVTGARAGSHWLCGRAGRWMDEGGNLLADPCARCIRYSWYNCTMVPWAEGMKATVFIPESHHQDIFLRVAGKVNTDMLSSARSVLCSHPCNTPSIKRISG